MRVVFVLPDLPLAGTATRTTRWAVLLVQRGHDVHLVTLTDRVHRSIEDRLIAGGVDLIRMTRPVDVLRLLRMPRGNLVLHAALPTAGIVALLLRRTLSAPVVYSFTNSLHRNRPFRRLSPRDVLKERIEATLLRHGDLLHAVANGTALQVLDADPATSTRLVTLVDAVAAPVHTRRPGPAGGPRLLCMARLTEHKDVESVLRVTAILRMSWPDVRLTVLGTGPQHGQLIRLTRDLGLTAALERLGQTHEPSHHLAHADVLVHPSRYEGYPQVVAEAHARGVPAVLLDSPHGREAARYGPVVLARPGDLDALARAVREAVAGARRAPAHLGAAGTDAEQIEALHERALRSSRAQGR
jgi:glycosyltransferase involved in cell wall biosynthesis